MLVVITYCYYLILDKVCLNKFQSRDESVIIFCMFFAFLKGKATTCLLKPHHHDDQMTQPGLKVQHCLVRLFTHVFVSGITCMDRK